MKIFAALLALAVISSTVEASPLATSPPTNEKTTDKANVSEPVAKLESDDLFPKLSDDLPSHDFKVDAVGSTTSKSLTEHATKTNPHTTATNKHAPPTTPRSPLTHSKSHKKCCPKKKEHDVKIHVGQGQIVFFTGVCGPKSCVIKKDVIDGVIDHNEEN